SFSKNKTSFRQDKLNMIIVILSLFNLTQDKACFNLPSGSFTQAFMPRQISLKGAYIPTPIILA
ncbi:MAG: hypothetical protein ACTH5R_05155, partial [Vibrio litoralis]